MTVGKKLSRQISRYLGSDSATKDIAELLDVLRRVDSALIPAGTLKLLENFPVFLKAVDAAYTKYESNLAVAERTVAISSEESLEVNRSIHAMVNSLGQGFLTFDANGVCGSVYSKACETLLETIPAGKSIVDVLRLDPERAATVTRLLSLVFSDSHAMSFDEVIHFAPDFYTHSAGSHIRLDYRPNRSPDGRLDRIVVVATDVSNQVRAQELADERKMLFESIERALRDRQSFGSFMRRVGDLIRACADPGVHHNTAVLMRELHTLKGGASMFRLTALADNFHDVENAVKSYALHTLPSEILEPHARTLHAQTEIIATRFKDLLGIDVLKLERESYIDRDKLYHFGRYLELLGNDELYRIYVDQVCAESLRHRLQAYDLLLTDLANDLNKKIKPLFFSGTDIALVEPPYRLLFESFVHIFRNIMNHGIEYPSDRVRNGKDEAGQVHIRTGTLKRCDLLYVTIDIEDDGAGVDMEKIRLRLNQADPEGKWTERSERDVLDGMLKHTVSTTEDITKYAGRGVGISAVYAEVMKLGGSLSVSSTAGRGTIFHITFPYSTKL